MLLKKRTKYILKNSLQAVFSLLIIAVVYTLFVELIYKQNPDFWIEKFYSKPLIIYSIYVLSEVFFGLFPPELFMLWAINKGSSLSYLFNLGFFTAVSFGAGHLAFYIGNLLSKRYSNRLGKFEFIKRYLPVVKKYGGILIIIAALTPVPWTTVSLIMGTTNFNYRKFTLYSLFRIARFIVYGYIIFQTHQFFFI
jgi:membrane protein DedA with SNARE-associated domain